MSPGKSRNGLISAAGRATGTFRLRERRMAKMPALQPMDKAVAYAISAFIVVFGVVILLVGIHSSSPAIWTCVAVVLIAIGLVSAFGDC
jgi:hypothetical protein